MASKKNPLNVTINYIQKNVNLLGIIAGLIAQYFALKTMIHDEITERLASEKIFEYRIDALEKKTAFNTHHLPLPDQTAIVPPVVCIIRPASRFKYVRYV